MTRAARVLAALAAAFLSAAGCAHTQSAPPAAQGPPTVAVWDLEDLGASQPGLGEILSAQVAEAIQAQGRYAVIEREKLLLALGELRLGSSELADEGTRLRLGRIAGARYMVFGGYQVVAGRMRLDLRLVEVETGKIRKAVSRTADGGDLAAWLAGARAAGSEL